MIISDGINHNKLQTIIVGELKKAGLKHRLKKIILKSVKDNKTVFGAPLVKVPSCSVICCGSTLSVPIVVNEMSAILRSNAHIEGIFRKAGSQNRQKDIKRILDAGGCVSDGHHPIDVASVLKLFLRTLPEPLISAEVQDLLLRCRLTAGEDALQPILHTLLLLPVLHVHLLHYIMELLNFIASKHKDNLMDSSNLAIVMAPSMMPLPVASTAQRLEHHVALVKMFIENSKHIGMLTEELMTQLDDESEMYLARRKKRRSGSINRVFHGLRKMVSGSVHTPATVREHGTTPILSKSASKRKFDGYEGLSAKTRKKITLALPHKELSFTPMKMGKAEKKKLRLSFMDANSTPIVEADFVSCKHSEISISSEDMLTSSEHLFEPHDTIDLSPDTKPFDKDYVKISKLEYEEIKSRVSAIENRLSREFTDVTNTEPLHQVQSVYEQTLEDVAMLHCPKSDHLARRLSKELKIRPSEEGKIIRSPSARKIGTIRRRSKENVTKIVRHKSWNVSSASQSSHGDAQRFYPYVATQRARTRNSEDKVNFFTYKKKNYLVPKWSTSESENSFNNSESSQNISFRRFSNSCDYKLKQTVSQPKGKSSLNTTINSWDVTPETSVNSTLNSMKMSLSPSQVDGYVVTNKPKFKTQKSPAQTHPKWKSAAAFFMDKNGEIESCSQTGRPSVNKLRSQNAGAVLAKAKLFESSSDKSSELNDRVLHTGFARKPRLSGILTANNYKCGRVVGPTRMKMPENDGDKLPNISRLNKPVMEVAPIVPPRSLKQRAREQQDITNWRTNINKVVPSPRKVVSPPYHISHKSLHGINPIVKKSLLTSRNVRSPACATDNRKINTPLKAIHTSPRRRSPRLKPHKVYTTTN